MQEQYILAIDQSTSGTKAVLINREGDIVHRANAMHRQYYPEPGWVEHDPTEIIQKTYSAIEDLFQETQIEPTQIAAIGISNQRETVLIWDKKSGEPVYNAVVWQCGRATEICNEISAQGHADSIKEKTGLVLSPYFPAAKLKWLLENVKGLAKRAEQHDVVFGTIDSWLLWNLTGGKVHATDYSNASRTQLFNLQEGCWDKEVCDIFSIPVEMASEIRHSNDVFGCTATGTVFGCEIPITCLLGDSHAALFAQSCFEKGMTKTTYGTGSSIMMNIGKQLLKSKSGIVTSIAWGMDGAVDYAFEGNINCSGDTVQWLVDELQLIPNTAVSEGIATSIEDSEGVYLVPAFVGLGAPHWDYDARAALIGMSRRTGKAHVVRAAIESIAYQIKDVIGVMVSESGSRLKELRVDGGATRNDFLMQFQADMIDVPVVCSATEELSAMGSGYMAGLKIGFWDSKEEIQSLRKVGKVFEPKLSPERRERLYNGWKNAVKRTLTR